MKNTPISYSLYQMTYEDDLPIEQYYAHMFDQIPSKYENHQNYQIELIEHLKSIGFEQEMNVEVSVKKDSSVERRMYINKASQMMVAAENRFKSNTNTNLTSFKVYYNIKLGKLENQLNLQTINEFVITKKKSNVHLITSDRGTLETEPFYFDVEPINLKLNYGSKFEGIHDIIINRLNNDKDKGLILFHGEPGSGKSSYIKYLTSIIKNKEVLFIPPSMAEMLSEPTIIPFLMQHRNSILVIEDAERVIGDREGNGSATGVSNILNLTDGILGDCLNIQIIATFNMKRERIDQALLRKGRLIAEHKFQKLSASEANKLLKHIGKDFVVNESMSLADIYNIDIEEIRASEEKQRIGFLN